MKALILFFLITPFALSSQVLSYSDLYKILDMSATDIDSYLSARGYMSLGVENTNLDNDEHVQWIHNTNNQPNKFNQITITYNKGGSRNKPASIVYKTNSLTAYQTFKSELTTRSYTYLETDNFLGVLTHYYKKSGVAIWWLSNSFSQDDGFTTYSIGGGLDK